MREARSDVMAVLVVIAAIAIGTPILALVVMPAVAAAGVIVPAVIVWRRIRRSTPDRESLAEFRYSPEPGEA